MARRLDILLQVIESWRARDLEATLAHFDDEIVWHYAAAAAPPVRGREAARRLLTRFQNDMRDINWRIFAHADVGDRLFVEGVDEYLTPQGVRICAPYAGVLDFRGDRIVGWRDYVDTATIAAQRDGSPITAHATELANRPALGRTASD